MRRKAAELDKLKDLARILYTKDGKTFKDIAIIVEVTEHTIGKWAKHEKWKDHRKSLLRTKEEQLKELYNQLQEFNSFIKKKPEGLRFPDSKEADALSKIAKSIKEMETELGVDVIIDVFIVFSNWLKIHDFEMAKKFAALQDEFVKGKLR